ncbi:MHYT domain-containing protein [Pseudoduganella namucuonensis]|uniref:Sensory/regulatory protein RpfC n=1 Tax=Pseudoduganella namucuonensis TaxID=1035707 RepID=A0A1I7EVM4_9BURK|nr:MHYT domain-containing protein [Pseudoduganella namucuonensis]SFU27976.1 multi-sensor hybrid histidine kinase [Pseudoduganella namucuonensis]
MNKVTDYLAQLFSPPADPSLLTYGIYDPWLVVLSVVVASFSSWMGLQMAGQAANATMPSLRRASLLTGSLALGSGVWSMHFIGMLAFNLCTAVEYDRGLTIWSMLPSVAASAVALSIIGRKEIGGWQLLTGGVLVGAGIGAMHYTGMAAMRSTLELRYDPYMFGLSILVAVALATLALWVRFGLSAMRARLSGGMRLLIAGVTMGCAIAGMHYTGMAAARFVGRVEPDAASGIANEPFLALAISLITAAFTLLVVSANGLLRYRALFFQLRESESWMRALLATAVDGVITVESDGTIREFNASAERIFGWKREEILGKHVRVLIADPVRSLRDGLLSYLKDGREGMIGESQDILGVHKSGARVPVRNAYGHARLANLDLYVIFVTDISERKAMEQALRDSEQQFRSLIGNIPGISYRSLMAPGWPMVFISAAVETLTGYPPEEFLGTPPRRTYSDLIHPDDHAQVAQGLEAAIAAGEPFVLEYRLRHRDGSIRWMWENGSAIFDERGKVKWLDGVILDISGRRQMEEDLRAAKERAEQAAAARSAFLANMSHEIRTPMNSILGFTDVLLQGELAADQRRHLNTVRNSARSLLRLLNEILDTAKLDKGAVELELNDYNLLALIDELSSTMGSNASAKGLTLTIAYSSALPHGLHGDELRVRQVLTNLLGNAIKFTGKGSVELDVEKETEDGRDVVHFTVSDTGIGIPADRMASIFEPFMQADASMNRRYGGTGLGTTICKQLTELMGGRIWAASVEGEGSAFHVVLPLAPATTQPWLRRDTATPLALPPLRILAADDVPQNLELLTLLLGKRGHTIITASDGAVAAQLAAEGSFDVILMDVQMPSVDGLESTRRIRADEAARGRPRVPIIAMTASVLDKDREATSEAGMEGFAPKPVDMNVLSRELARVLGLEIAEAPGPGGAADGPQVLNGALALRRWAGHEDVYHRSLRMFAAERGGVAEELAALAAGERHADGAALAHQVKGAAGNLGLEQLAAALGQLEHAWQTLQAADSASGDAGGAAGNAASAPPDLGPLLHAVAEQMAAACGAIAIALAAAGGDGARTAPAGQADAAAAAHAVSLDLARVRGLATTLHQSIDSGSFDDQTMHALARALSGHVDPQRVSELQQAVDDFDFSTAHARLEALLASCQPPSAGSPT